MIVFLIAPIPASPSSSPSFDILSHNRCSSDFAAAERHHGGADAPMEGQRGMCEGQKKRAENRAENRGREREGETYRGLLR